VAAGPSCPDQNPCCKSRPGSFCALVDRAGNVLQFGTQYHREAPSPRCLPLSHQNLNSRLSSMSVAKLQLALYSTRLPVSLASVLALPNHFATENSSWVIPSSSTGTSVRFRSPVLSPAADCDQSGQPGLAVSPLLSERRNKLSSRSTSSRRVSMI
jgi:hypothetical protein